MSYLSFKVSPPPERPEPIYLPFWLVRLACIIVVLIAAAPMIVFLLVKRP